MRSLIRGDINRCRYYYNFIVGVPRILSQGFLFVTLLINKQTKEDYQEIRYRNVYVYYINIDYEITVLMLVPRFVPTTYENFIHLLKYK